ncbi:hypothetical protein BH23THE1_BH23THE1_32640 [soil metagenome]
MSIPSIPLYYQSISPNLFYQLGDNSYNARTLERTDNQYQNQNKTLILENVNTVNFLSEPVLVITPSGFLIYQTDDNNLFGVNTMISGDQSRLNQILNEAPNRIFDFKIPNVTSVSDLPRLPELSLPVFQPGLRIQLNHIQNTNTLRQFLDTLEPTQAPVRSPRRSPTPEPIIPFTEPFEPITSTLQNESYETLLKQLYGIPIQLPDFLVFNSIRSNFISFPEVTNMFSQNQVERYIIDPLLQPWAGPPSTQNRIITIFTKNGMTYLVKVRYDQERNQIYPPV